MSAEKKLIIKGIAPEAAAKLVAAGLMTPKAIKSTTLIKLREITGLTQSGARKLKGLFE